VENLFDAATNESQCGVPYKEEDTPIITKLMIINYEKIFFLNVYYLWIQLVITIFKKKNFKRQVDLNFIIEKVSFCTRALHLNHKHKSTVRVLKFFIWIQNWTDKKNVSSEFIWRLNMVLKN